MGLDRYHAHEALDRTLMIADMIENFLLEHPWIKENRDVCSKIEQASDLLGEAYQDIGIITLKED